MRIEEPFYRRGAHFAIALPGAQALFTTRRGGCSRGAYASLNLGRLTDDDPGAVRRNRETVESEVGSPLTFVRQVHGARVQTVDAAGSERAGNAKPDEMVPADGQVTREGGLALTALTADCLPVAVAGNDAVAMLHAGWRGLRDGVIAAGVVALRELGADGPLRAAIGPGAGPCCYEVGGEVVAAFADEPGALNAERKLDLKAITRAQLEHAGVAEVHDIGLCTICSDPALLFSHRRDHGVTGRQAGYRMVELIHGLDPGRIRANLEQVRTRIADAGRDPAEVEILAAVKYVPVQELVALAEAGVELVGENRAQELISKQDAVPDRFTWDFIGNLQSRKVRDLVGRVRYIHSVATESALSQLARHGTDQTRVLIEVNVAGDRGKSGIEPSELPSFLERCPVTAVGLMTMPPLAQRPQDNRDYFASLHELAARHGLHHLSMGTSQDYEVAVQEGATIVRLGTTLYAGAP